MVTWQEKSISLLNCLAWQVDLLAGNVNIKNKLSCIFITLPSLSETEANILQIFQLYDNMLILGDILKFL